MGSPGWTSFCDHGHIVDVCGHHEVLMEEQEICPVCKSSNIKIVAEWRDEEYDGPNPIVPYEPKIIKKDITHTCTHCGKVDVINTDEEHIYDVSKLFCEITDEDLIENIDNTLNKYKIP